MQQEEQRAWVLDKGDERGDDNGDALAQLRRQLVA